MKKLQALIIKVLLIACPSFVFAQVKNSESYKEPYRPQIHYSPKANWMNDPNGMVYYKGTYHLFYQYCPQGITFGPVYWGHAESKDLIHWKELPPALSPDKLGYIFSGSAVADLHNTSGFGKNGQVPLVAIFTNHNPKLEKQGSDRVENQSLAYSLDEGKSWTKYSGNPVLKNPGIKDFRDPKVMWYEAGHKWVMTLATHDRVSFYSSQDLKQWTKETEFGKNEGGHGGVWECPDLFPLALNGRTYWVLLVNINPGGPNKGSATQYFIGRFDGHRFMPASTQEHWVEYGPDNYAGVTWSNTGNRRIFIGWMSNWLYAINSPTEKWRNAMTIPRELGLKQEGDQILLTSQPVTELNIIAKQIYATDKVTINKSINITGKGKNAAKQYLLNFSGKQLIDFSLKLSNSAGQNLTIGYDSHTNQYFIDRSLSGDVSFNKQFAGRYAAPRLTKDKAFDITLIVDASSVELFADGGLSNMTSIFFSSRPMNTLSVQSSKGIIVDKVRISTLKSIW